MPSGVTSHLLTYRLQVAEKYGRLECGITEPPLFISDVRAADWQVMSDKETEAQVKEDMKNQMEWAKACKSKACMLKFRLPWDVEKQDYMKGEVRLPVFGPITTSESRLVCVVDEEKQEYPMMTWNNRKYESQMFFFNTHTRVNRYPHGSFHEGMDCCYDCTAEVQILYRYMEYMAQHCGDAVAKLKGAVADIFNDPQVAVVVKKMREDTLDHDSGEDRAAVYCCLERLSALVEISSSLHRKLWHKNPDPQMRKQVIMKRQYRNGMPAYVDPNARQETGARYNAGHRRTMSSDGMNYHGRGERDSYRHRGGGDSYNGGGQHHRSQSGDYRGAGQKRKRDNNTEGGDFYSKKPRVDSFPSSSSSSSSASSQSMYGVRTLLPAGQKREREPEKGKEKGRNEGE